MLFIFGGIGLHVCI